MKKKIKYRVLYNAIKTPDGTILESHSTHDFVQYTDKNGNYYAVDGGKSYLKRMYDVSDYKELGVVDNGRHATRRKYLKWGSNYDKNMNRLPETIWKPIKDLSATHIKNIIKKLYCTDPFYLEVFKKELKYRSTSR